MLCTQQKSNKNSMGVCENKNQWQTYAELLEYMGTQSVSFIFIKQPNI